MRTDLDAPRREFREQVAEVTLHPRAVERAVSDLERQRAERRRGGGDRLDA